MMMKHVGLQPSRIDSGGGGDGSGGAQTGRRGDREYEARKMKAGGRGV